MTYDGVIDELRSIAEQSAEAAERGGREDELLEAYVMLRERAVALAKTKELATAERLVELSSWAIGARRAYETLEDDWR